MSLKSKPKKKPKNCHQALFPAVVLVAVLAMSWDWPQTGAIAALTVLAISIWNTFVSPEIRKRKLKHPCDAYFHIRELGKGELTYVVQDDEAHNVKEIVLPSNSIVEIEIAYNPRIPFNVDETVFQCDGDDESKPIVEEPVHPFMAKGDLPIETSYWNRHGGYHYGSRYVGRAVGSCYTKGFKLRTKKPGIYKTWLGFLTDEINGEATDLVIRVEDKPSTRMNCAIHQGCKVRPCRVIR